MSWTDKQSIRVINYLKDKYKIKTLVETGTHKGVNALVHSKNFEQVITCELDDDYFAHSRNKFRDVRNVICIKETSPKFLKRFRTRAPLMFYLDAHFYDPKLKQKFVVLDELKALRNHGKCVIIIHDFDNNLGHINYDGQPLNMDLIRKDLKKVGKLFYYTNTLASCDIIKYSEVTDFDMIENIEYVYSKPEKTYRGLLYALPTKLTKKEMNDLGLIEWN